MARDGEAETKPSKIKLDYINTDTAAKNFAKMLDEKKTFFLNGSWGSGKTEFLRNTNNHSNKKFRYLKLWEVKDKKSVVSLSFRTLLPKTCWLLIVLLVIGTNGTLYTNKFNIPIFRYLEYNIFTLGLLGLTITYGIVKSLGVKLDDIYIEFLKTLSSEKIGSYIINIMGFTLLCLLFYNVYIIYKFKIFIIKLFCFIITPIILIISDAIFLRKSVLILDDFDRIPEDRRKEAYMVFNILNNRIPIVFVGDYENILDDNKCKYLQKVIDVHVELPYVINPSKIWASYFDSLSTKMGVNISEDFKSVVYEARLNLREREHFNDYVCREFFDRSKIGRVQTEQQLLTILIYLFYREYYLMLIEEAEHESDEHALIDDYLEEIHTENKNLNEKETRFSDITQKRLSDEISKLRNDARSLYPIVYKHNKKGYFIFESPSNLSIDELNAIVTNPSQLKKYMSSNYEPDFYDYLVSENNSPLRNNNEIFLDLVLELINENENSGSIEYVIHKNNKDIIGNRKLACRELFDEWKPILKKHGFDLSMMFYFFNRYYILSFKNMGEIYPNLDMSSNCRKLDHLLNVYISAKELWRRYEKWDNTIWSVIDSLPDEQFLSFWVFQDLFSNGSDDFYFIPKNKCYTIFYEKHPHPKLFPPDSDIISHYKTLKKINARLGELESKGYNFVYEKGFYYPEY